MSGHDETRRHVSVSRLRVRRSRYQGLPDYCAVVSEVVARCCGWTAKDHADLRCCGWRTGMPGTRCGFDCAGPWPGQLVVWAGGRAGGCDWGRCGRMAACFSSVEGAALREPGGQCTRCQIAATPSTTARRVKQILHAVLDGPEIRWGYPGTAWREDKEAES
jgi:hypothetical protein